MSDALIQRWDGFLNQIKERFQGLMTEAKDGCAQLLRATELNTIAMANAWTGIESRCKDLESKVSDTWSQAVEPKFEEAGVANAIIQQQRAKGDALKDWLEIERERNMVAIYIETAKTIFDDAKTKMGDWKCKQCGGKLTVPWVFRSVNVSCPYCQAVNTYEPGTGLRMIEAMAIHPMCQSRAWNEWLGMRAADDAWKAARPGTIDKLKAYERSQIAYWTAYLRAKGEFLPDTAKDFELDLKGKMRWFYTFMENEAVWTKAGRPRDLPT